MSTEEQNQVETNDIKLQPGYEKHEVTCPTVGKINVYVQTGRVRRKSQAFLDGLEGSRTANDVVILTVHDLGCNFTQFEEFVQHRKMQPIADRTVWVHVSVPGQEPDAPDIPGGQSFPTMQQLGEDLICVLDQLKLGQVVCFGEGAGANILARFAIAHIERVLGVCLIHCTGTTAGFMESLKDRVIGWKLDHIGMNPTAEAYLVLHRFGSFEKAKDKDQLLSVIEDFQASLRTSINPKNLKKFVEAFLKRTNLTDRVGKLTCPVLLVTGQKASFNSTTHSLYQHLVKSAKDKGKVEFIQVDGCANVLHEEPEKLVESFQYFLQGLHLVSSIPMHHVDRKPRMRTMSMEEYDQPKLRSGSISGGSGSTSPLSTSPTAATTILSSSVPK